MVGKLIFAAGLLGFVITAVVGGGHAKAIGVACGIVALLVGIPVWVLQSAVAKHRQSP